MQNLRLIALIVWRYDVTEFSLEEGNESSSSADFTKIWLEHVLRIKTKRHQVWAS